MLSGGTARNPLTLAPKVVSCRCRASETDRHESYELEISGHMLNGLVGDAVIGDPGEFGVRDVNLAAQYRQGRQGCSTLS